MVRILSVLLYLRQIFNRKIVTVKCAHESKMVYIVHFTTLFLDLRRKPIFLYSLAVKDEQRLLTVDSGIDTVPGNKKLFQSLSKESYTLTLRE